MVNQNQDLNLNHYYLNRSLEPIKGEVWKEVSDFEGLYEVSNFGRVKALEKYREVVIPKRGTITYWTKELILKQSVKKFLNTYLKQYSYFLTVSLFKGGWYTTYTVARLVYLHFGPGNIKLTKDMPVLHKDNDSLHNHIKNLYPSSFGHMHEVIYGRQRKRSYFTGLNSKKRTAYTRKAAQANQKPVTQYTVSGKRIRCFHSIVAAARKTGVKKSSISSVIAGRYLTSGGYLWRIGKGKPVIDTGKIRKKINNFHNHKCKQVGQYSSDGKLLAEFPSIKIAAAVVNGSPRQLSDALNGRSKTAYGFVWKVVS